MHQLRSQHVCWTADSLHTLHRFFKNGMAQVYLHYPYERTVEPLARATERRFGVHIVCTSC